MREVFPLEAALYNSTGQLLNAFTEPSANQANKIQQVAHRGRQLARDLPGSLKDVQPPPEAQAYHTDLLRTAPHFEAMFAHFESLASSSLDRSNDAGSPPSSWVTDAGELAIEGKRLAILALRQRPDSPLATYLITALGLQLDNQQASGRLFTSLLGSSAQTSVALSEARRAQERFLANWNRLTPPPLAAGLHGRQATLIADSFVTTDPVAFNSVGSDPTIQQQFVRVSAKGMILNADWEALIAEALSDPVR